MGREAVERTQVWGAGRVALRAWVYQVWNCGMGEAGCREEAWRVLRVNWGALPSEGPTYGCQPLISCSSLALIPVRLGGERGVFSHMSFSSVAGWSAIFAVFTIRWSSESRRIDQSLVSFVFAMIPSGAGFDAERESAGSCGVRVSAWRDWRAGGNGVAGSGLGKTGL